MKKRELEKQLRLRDEQLAAQSEYYHGIERLLDDLSEIFPNLNNENWSGLWYGGMPRPKLADKLKRDAIHLVAQHYRDEQAARYAERRIDLAMENIGL